MHTILSHNNELNSAAVPGLCPHPLGGPPRPTVGSFAPRKAAPLRLCRERVGKPSLSPLRGPSLPPASAASRLPPTGATLISRPLERGLSARLRRSHRARVAAKRQRPGSCDPGLDAPHAGAWCPPKQVYRPGLNAPHWRGAPQLHVAAQPTSQSSQTRLCLPAKAGAHQLPVSPDGFCTAVEPNAELPNSCIQKRFLQCLRIAN